MSQRKKENNKIKALAQKVEQLSVKRNKQKKKKRTPFGDTGSIVGGSLGGMFGNSKMGSGIGRWLGSGIGSIFGSGDYALSGSSPKYNVLTNGSQIPQFDSGRQTNVVCHREYLGDIYGTAGFNNRLYPLNPGVNKTFPWLSSLAVNYQEYKFHGLVFEFRSLITDFVTGGAPGVVIMSTSYNADADQYLTKQQMENAEFAVSVKPTNNLMHGIECDDRQTPNPIKYIRNGDVPYGQDKRLYDLGTFQFATQSNPTQDLGELWVSYCVEFLKPVLPSSGPDPGPYEEIQRFGAASSAPFGLIGVSERGQLDVVVDSTSIKILNAEPHVNYLIDVVWFNVGAPVVFDVGTISFAGCVDVPRFNRNADGVVKTPAEGTTVDTAGMQFFIKSTSSESVQDITVSVGSGGLYPTGNVDIKIMVKADSIFA